MTPQRKARMQKLRETVPHDRVGGGIRPVQLRQSIAERRALEAASEPGRPVVTCSFGHPVAFEVSLVPSRARRAPTWLAVLFGIIVGISARECTGVRPAGAPVGGHP